MELIGFLILLLVAPQESAPDPNDTGATGPKRSINLRLFRDADRSVIGSWNLELPGAPGRRIDLQYVHEGSPDALIGLEMPARTEILSLDRKKEGIGYEGTLKKVFSDCGIEEVPVTEFVPIGDAVVLRFLTSPTPVECPPIDGGESGRFVLVSPRDEPVVLKDLNAISSSRVRSAYGIGGDRPNLDRPAEPFGAVSVDAGTEVRFIKRFKAPLDGSYWYEVEVSLDAHQGLKPVRGYVDARSLQFIGALTLKRAP